MTTNQTIDGVPRKFLAGCATWFEQLGDVISVERAKELRALLEAPAENMIDVAPIRWSEIQKAATESTWMPPEYIADYWVDDVCRFLREGPAVQPPGEPVVQVIDLDAVDWEAIQKAADESSWMPNEYMRNEWVADVCNFLKYGRAEQPAPVAVSPTCCGSCPGGCVYGLKA